MLKREEITRERVESLIAETRQYGNFSALTHTEREQNRKQFLEDRPKNEDLWIFGYGSLIWNPAFHFVEKRRALVYGYSRRYCLLATIGRGTPETPGLMLALDRGGSCHGMAFRIAARQVESETDILWMREMISGAYIPRWLRMKTEQGELKGLTFVVNRTHERYLKCLSLEETVAGIIRGKGSMGNCREYLNNTVECLKSLGIRDDYLQRLQRRIQDL